MKWTPLLFKGEMVRAILNGTKTETRRLVKPQPFVDPKWGLTWEPKGHANNKPSYIALNLNWNPITKAFADFYRGKGGSPYGGAGDRIWVKETFRLSTSDDCSCYEPCGCKIGVPIYRASITDEDPELDPPWKSSMLMPRKFCRITLEITSVHAERLHAITDDGAIAEGIDTTQPFKVPYKGQYMATPVLRYEFLWESINGQGSWKTNPWVWVIKFRRLHGNVID